jgi:hypothetical protein
VRVGSPVIFALRKPEQGLLPTRVYIEFSDAEFHDDEVHAKVVLRKRS